MFYGDVIAVCCCLQ